MKVFTAILFLFSMSTYAQDGKKFTQHKTQVLANIDQRISAIQEFKSCVQSANDHAAMKTCRTKHQSKMSTMKDTMKNMKENKK